MNGVQFFSATFSRRNFMKGLSFFFTFLSLCLACEVKAQSNFFNELIVSDEIQQEQVRESGTLEAGKLLDTKPTVLKVQNQRKKVKKVEADKPAPVIRDPAPMGLKWMATVAEIEYLHVRLIPIEIKDMPNSYQAENLPNPVSDFREVDLSFGEADALWRIASYGKFIDDDASASKGLKEYRKYYQLLEKKYGNAQQFYTPAAVNVDEVTAEGELQTVQTRPMTIGENGFLQKLMSGEASLYATFENGKIGVTLALYADGNAKTYIVVDYKDLTTGKQELEDLYNAL